MKLRCYNGQLLTTSDWKDLKWWWWSGYFIRNWIKNLFLWIIKKGPPPGGIYQEIDGKFIKITGKTPRHTYPWENIKTEPFMKWFPRHEQTNCRCSHPDPVRCPRMGDWFSNFDCECRCHFDRYWK